MIDAQRTESISQTDRKGVSDKGSINPSDTSLFVTRGAITGIDEKFTANPVNGIESIMFPLDTAAVPSWFSPQLSLSHDSRAGNGVFGLSWSVLCRSIARRTESGTLKYKVAEESHVFNPLGVEEPIPITGPYENPEFKFSEICDNVCKVVSYRSLIDGLCACVDQWTGKKDADTERVSITKVILTWSVKTVGSNIAERSDVSQSLTWLTCESFGDKGNFSLHRYTAEDLAEGDLYQPIELKSLEQRQPTSNQYEDLTQKNDWLVQSFLIMAMSMFQKLKLTPDLFLAGGHDSHKTIWHSYAL